MSDKNKDDKSLGEEAVDAVEQVGKVVLKTSAVAVKTGLKAGTAVTKGIGSGIKKFGEKRKEKKALKEAQKEEE